MIPVVKQSARSTHLQTTMYVYFSTPASAGGVSRVLNSMDMSHSSRCCVIRTRFADVCSENLQWTDMAYVGNTGALCQAICDSDVEYVKNWCTLEGSSLDRRDHTGRTPLQLATQCSSIEVVRCLIDNGARIVARLVDGMTALHIAAS